MLQRSKTKKKIFCPFHVLYANCLTSMKRCHVICHMHTDIWNDCETNVTCIPTSQNFLVCQCQRSYSATNFSNNFTSTSEIKVNSEMPLLTLAINYLYNYYVFDLKVVNFRTFLLSIMILRLESKSHEIQGW